MARRKKVIVSWSAGRDSGTLIAWRGRPDLGRGLVVKSCFSISGHVFLASPPRRIAIFCNLSYGASFFSSEGGHLGACLQSHREVCH